MHFDLSDLTPLDIFETLNDLALVGPARHLLIEVFLAYGVDRYERPKGEEHYCAVLGLEVDKTRVLLRDLVAQDILSCAQDMKTWRVTDISLHRSFITFLKDKHDREEAASQARMRVRSQLRPPTEGVKRRARELFDGTCELCGDKAHRGKDQHGGYMFVARIKKDRDGVADNVTLLCSACANGHRGRDLPAECRTLENLLVAEQRGYEFAPRTAAPLPKPIKEVILIASGPISVKTRNFCSDSPEMDELTDDKEG